MKLGIKVGPRQESIIELDETHATACEVWFNIAKIDDYTELFKNLKQRPVDVGLHFWGALPDSTLANIAFPDTARIKASRALIEQTIDCAAQNGFSYVNIHPGARATASINFDKEEVGLRSKPVSLETATNLFLEHADALSEYAKHRGVVLTVETVPQRVVPTNWYDPDARSHPLDIYELPAEVIVQAAARGIPVANDFGHTAGNVITDNPTDVWQYLDRLTDLLAPQTRLIHLGFVVPPYSGADFHDHLDNPLLETNQAVPNRKQILELLQHFKNRHDIWIITEPNGQHARNYFLAQKILQESGIDFS